MSIMIDMPPAAVEKAESYAQERGMTLARLFSEYVASLDLRKNDLAESFFDLVDAADVHMPKNWKFDRESCYA